MMRFMRVLAAAALVSPLAAAVPTPGHYGGGLVSFRLTASGEIHNLRIRDRLVAHEAGHLVKGDEFHFRHPVKIHLYRGEGAWESETRCAGEFFESVPSVSPREAHHKWHAHRLED